MFFTLGLTNLDLVFIVKGWILGIWFQIFKNKKKLKFSNKKRLFWSFFFLRFIFCEKNLKSAI